jgi:hypothetical protein
LPVDPSVRANPVMLLMLIGRFRRQGACGRAGAQRGPQSNGSRTGQQG